jgi:hypothetical protein
MHKIKKRAHRKRSNIFTRYFIVFASIFLVTFLALGTSLILMVNSYSRNEKTALLEENAQTIAESISDILIVNDMNSAYSSEKEMICDSLATVSGCIDSDVFVCDVEGNVILCKEMTGTKGYHNASMVCTEHSSFKVEDELIQKVYENGTASARAEINGKSCFVVGTAIIAPDYAQEQAEGSSGIIGTVFAAAEEGVTALVMNIIRTFLIIAVVCLGVGFFFIWLTTKRMVTPLRQMSTAAKSFAVSS